MQTNVTLKMDAAILKEARKAAVDENTSLSAWVARLIVEQVRKRDLRRAARTRALQALESGFDLKPGLFTREELHER